MKRIPIRPLVVTLLFAGLVVTLLWFQGILGRHALPAGPVPDLAPAGPEARQVVVVERSIPEVEAHPGHVQAEAPTELSARVMAHILTLTVREGDPVSAGAPLVTLDDREAQAALARAEAALAAAQAEARRAELQARRVERLRAASAATDQEWEATSAASAAAGAMVRAAEKSLEEARAMASHYVVAAPAAGVVLARHADPGDLALPGRPLLSVYEPGALRLAVAVPDARAASVRLDQELVVQFLGQERTARVRRLLPGSDPATGSVTVHLVPEDTRGLRPGMLGRLLLPLGERRVRLLAAAAIRRTGQVEWVELVRAGRLVPVTVRTGRVHGTDIEIQSGLSAGERVQLP